MELFRFTEDELETMRHRLHLMHWRAYWRAESYEPDVSDMTARVSNEVRFGEALDAVRTGTPSPCIPLDLLDRVYDMAWTAYRVARTLGRPHDEARRSALVYGQIPLDKWLQADATGQVFGAKVLHELGRRWLQQGRV